MTWADNNYLYRQKITLDTDKTLTDGFEYNNYNFAPIWTVESGTFATSGVQKKTGSYALSETAEGWAYTRPNGTTGDATTLTWTAWIYPNPGSANYVAYVLDQSDADGWPTNYIYIWFHHDNGAQMRVVNGGADNTYTLGAGSFTDNNWYQVKLVLDRGTNKVSGYYYNSSSELQGSSTDKDCNSGNIFRVKLRAGGNDTHYFDDITYGRLLQSDVTNDHAILVTKTSSDSDFWSHVSNGYSLSASHTLWNDNLVSYYKLDETSGTTADDAKGANDGTTDGATVNQTGKITKAYDFNGNATHVDNVEMANESNFDFLCQATPTFSVSYWFKCDTDAPVVYAGVVSKYDDAADKGFEVYFEAGTIMFRLKTDNSNQIRKHWHVNYSDNAWHHVVWTANDTTIALYYDGIERTLDDNNVGTYSNGANDSNFSIGGRYNASTYGYDGLLDEVAVFNDVLSSAEAIALYNYQRGGNDVKFYDSDDSTALDYHLEKFDSVNQSMVAWVEVTDTFDKDANTELYMYYGYASATNGENKSGTYPAAYTTIWHMDDVVKPTDIKGALTTTNSASAPTSQQAGKINKAFNFSGTSQYFTTETVFSGKSTISWSMWINADSWTTNTNEILVSKWQGEPGTTAIASGNDAPNSAKLNYSLRNSGHTIKSAGLMAADCPTSTWINVAGTWDKDGVIALYVNGWLQSSLAGGGSAVDDDGGLSTTWFAYDTGTDCEFDGKVSEVKIWSTSLTRDEIALLYDSENSGLQSFGVEEDKPEDETSDSVMFGTDF